MWRSKPQVQPLPHPCFNVVFFCSPAPAPSHAQPFNSPEEAIAEPTLQQIRDGIVREMIAFNPDIRLAQGGR